MCALEIYPYDNTLEQQDGNSETNKTSSNKYRKKKQI